MLTRLGYTHDGWATSPGGEKVYDLGGICKDNAFLTLYAHWTLKSMAVENEISSADDWVVFCKQIEGGKTYSGQTVRLMHDLHTGVPTKAGSYAEKAEDRRPFSGIFDGQGHTITAAIDDTGHEGTALIGCINGATIKNLTVAGSINGKKHAAAVVGFADGTGNRIEDCVVTASIKGDGHVGGLVGHVLTSDIDISGCVFSGLVKPDVKGVFIGWGDNGGTKNVTDCLYLMQNGQNLGGLDLVKGDGTVNVTNCYKTADAGSYGSLVTVAMPYNTIFKPVTATDGNTYYIPSTVSGVESAYEYTGSVIPVVPTVTADGRVLTEGTDYTYTINPATVQKSTLNSITFAEGKMFILEGTNTVATASNISETTLVPAAVLFDKGDNSTMLSTCEGKPLPALLADRTLYKDGKWNTLCLPFNTKLAGSPLEGATARPLTTASVTGTTLNLTFGDAVDELVVGTPYIIKWTKAADYVDDDAHNIVSPVFKGATINPADNSYDNGEGGDLRVRFLGTYSSTPFEAEDNSVLLMGGENNLYYPATGAGIGAQRAYFMIGGGAAQTRGITDFNIDFGDGEIAAGVIGLTPDPSPTGEGSGYWYTIDGRKVANGQKPTAKGLYINNGKKVVIK